MNRWEIVALVDDSGGLVSRGSERGRELIAELSEPHCALVREFALANQLEGVVDDNGQVRLLDWDEARDLARQILTSEKVKLQHLRRLPDGSHVVFYKEDYPPLVLPRLKLPIAKAGK